MVVTAFGGTRRIATGLLREVALLAKDRVDRDASLAIAVFDDATGRPVEIDFRGTAGDVFDRLAGPADAGPPADPAPRGPGRPKLGVVAREVTLLPRHWEWLAGQPGGASVALRKLVDEARRTHEEKDRVRRSQEAAYRFMSDMAGDQPGFEEATRALFAADRARFEALVAAWPPDVGAYAHRLAEPVFEAAWSAS